MISVREFCREGDFPIAVFLTYSFDPLFFERIPWADLAIGGSRRILVVADATQAAEAVRRSIGQLAYLGRRYVLAEAALANAFHPKLIARLSAEGGRVWLGSGNLTYTGWGGNHELATSWPIGPREDDKGIWLDQLLSSLPTIVRSTSFEDQLRSIRNEARWLISSPASAENSSILFAIPGRPLAPQLAARWAGRRFDTLKLCTGSTDTGASFLAWASRTFGVKRAIVCLTPANASFDVTKLALLPMDIRIVKANPSKMMHAKFYWFSGPEGAAAVVGSANCSAAAWFGGNAELLVVYDNATEAEHRSALIAFRRPALTPTKALAGVLRIAVQEGRDVQPAFRLVSFRLRSGRAIEVVLDPQPNASAQVTLLIQREVRDLAIRLIAHREGSFIGRLPTDFVVALTTTFGIVEVVSDGTRYITEPRWLDNDLQLERANTIRTFDQHLRDLSRQSLFNSDHQRILEAIHAVSAQLLKASEQPIGLSAQPHQQGAASGEALDSKHDRAAVNPAAMVRSLSDLKRERQQRFGAQFFPYAGALTGVMAVLFAQDDQEELDLTGETWTASEPEKNLDDTGEVHTGQQVLREPGEAATQMPTSRETLIAFNGQLESFLDELAKPSFAEKCDASRMLQALAFPLLICLRGADAGWLAASQLGSVATRVAQIMFDQSYGKKKGLLRVVRDRYTTTDQLDEFQSVVGNGTLWSVLLAALMPDSSTPLRVLLPQATALTNVLQCPDLLTHADAPQLSSLVQSVLIKNAEENITEKAVSVAQATSSLTELLATRSDALYREQGSGRRLQPAGSLLWSRLWGWKVTASEVYCPSYLNFDAAAACHPEIRGATKRLVEACEPLGRESFSDVASTTLPSRALSPVFDE